MKRFDSQDLRNVALIAHHAAGKTSLGEALLFVSKSVKTLGAVDNGTSNLDFDPEEHKRHMTISTSLGHCEWKKRKINFLDTPGETNFFAETQTCLDVVDAAVAVVSGNDGVMVGLERAWARADELSMPRAVFINKLDRERSSFETTLNDIQENLSPKAIPLHLPIGAELAFKGVVDLISLKAHVFKNDKSGDFTVADVPAELRDDASAARQRLVEAVAESDDHLIEVYLETGELSEEDLHKGLASAISRGALFPVLCGSATAVIGVQDLLDMVADHFPSPVSGSPLKGKNEHGDPVERARSEKEPFSALAFKTIIDPFVGKLTLCRVYSGTAAPDTSFYNPNRRVRERSSGLFSLNGKKQDPLDGASAGDIIALSKLKDTHTRDTLCDEKSAILYELPPIPQPVIAFALKAKTKGDEDKLASALGRLVEEDPSLQIRRDEQTKEVLLSGLGQIQLEATVDKLRARYNVEVELLPPKIPYKETVKSRAQNVEGKHKKQTGGRGQFGVCYLNIEPLPRGSGFEFVDEIVGGSIPRQFIPCVEKGIRDRMTRGVIAGYPVEDVRVTVIDGKYHDVDSDQRSFEFAGSKGFQAAFRASKPILLEPIMEIEVTCPAENMGDVIGDINSRRGRVLGMDNRGKNAVVKAQAPMSKLLRYAADLRSMTSGRGSFTMSAGHNEEVPPDEAQKIIAAYKGEAEEE
jgi:elongation factor G